MTSGPCPTSREARAQPAIWGGTPELAPLPGSGRRRDELGLVQIIRRRSLKDPDKGRAGAPEASMGIDDPPLRAMLLGAASELARPQVLMLNMTQDEFFRPDDAHVFFDAIPGQRK